MWLSLGLVEYSILGTQASVTYSPITRITSAVKGEVRNKEASQKSAVQ